MKDWKKRFKGKYDRNEFFTASYIYDFIDDNDVSAEEVFEYYNELINARLIKESLGTPCEGCKYVTEAICRPCEGCVRGKKDYYTKE